MSRTLELIFLAVLSIIAALTTHAWLASRHDRQQMQSTIASQKQVLDAAAAREHARDAALKATLAQIEDLKRATQTAQQIVAQLPQFIRLPQPITLSVPTSNPASEKSAAVFVASDECAENSTPPAKQPESGRSGTDERKGIGSDATSLPPRGPKSTAAPQESPRPGELQAPNPNNPKTTAPKETGSSGCPSITFSADRTTEVRPPSAADGSTNSSAQIPAADLKPLYNYVQDCRACQAQLTVAKQNASDDATKIAALTRERDAAKKAAKGGSFLQRLRRNALWFAIGAASGYVAARR